jgi:hypothetical protein
MVTWSITPLTVPRRSDRNYCVGRYGKGPCLSRATIRASYLDDYVEERVLSALEAEDGFPAQAVQADADLEPEHRELETAEHELALYLQTDLIAVVGQEAFIRGVQTRQQRTWMSSRGSSTRSSPASDSSTSPISDAPSRAHDGR